MDEWIHTKFKLIYTHFKLLINWMLILYVTKDEVIYETKGNWMDNGLWNLITWYKTFYALLCTECLLS